jgi:hypothetical protein
MTVFFLSKSLRVNHSTWKSPVRRRILISLTEGKEEQRKRK